VVLGGVFGISAGLLIIAAAIGWGVARVMSGGSPSMPPDRTRPWIEVAIAVGVVALGQLGLWVFSLAEGGVLAPIEYLSQTFGPLVPIQLVIAGVAAWWTAR
jgi:hypothetical protein